MAEEPDPMPNILYVRCDLKLVSKLCLCPCGCAEQIDISKSCPAGTRTEYTVAAASSSVAPRVLSSPPPSSPVSSNSVLLSTGAFVFQQDLLSISSIGSGSFRFGLNYLSNLPGAASVGGGFQFAQNVRLSRFSDGDISLSTGAHTTENFDYDSDTDTYSSIHNNTAAELTRQGAGIHEEYILSASDGSVTRFFGFTAEIAASGAPGWIKSFADRYGNTMSFTWVNTDGLVQLASVTDSYGRTVNYRYYGSDGFNRLREVEDFLGRQVTFQYDADGRLIAVMTPAILKGAKGNIFPLGTAFVFQYDTTNPRPERRNDMIHIWYPNQATAYIREDASGGRYVDVQAAQREQTPRYSVEYGQQPTDGDTCTDPRHDRPRFSHRGRSERTEGELAAGPRLAEAERAAAGHSWGVYREQRRYRHHHRHEASFLSAAA